MSKLFEIFIMWVLVYMGWCPDGLALAFTIIMLVLIVVGSITDALKKRLDGKLNESVDKQL